MKRSFLDRNFILISAAITLCLIVLLTCFSDNLYAKFSTVASDEAGARVAKFEVTKAGEWEQTLWSGRLAPGKSSVEKTIKIENKSEVRIKYTFIVENKSNNLRLQFSVTDSGGSKVDSNGMIEGEVAPNDSSSKEYKIKINWQNDDEASKNYEYAGMVDYITGTLKVEQVD